MKWVVVAVSAFAALALIGLCAFAFLYVSQQAIARAQVVPPMVFVTAPDTGTSAPAGSYLTVAATAMGDNPITRADLWIDGELVETHNSDLPEGTSPFYAYFDVLVSEGPHLLFVRATTRAGSSGQSLPVSVQPLEAMSPRRPAICRYHDYRYPETECPDYPGVWPSHSSPRGTDRLPGSWVGQNCTRPNSLLCRLT